MAARMINGPSREWSTAEQAADWLGVSRKTLEVMVNDGLLPEGTVMGERVKRWYWLDLVIGSELRRRKALKVKYAVQICAEPGKSVPDKGRG